jgi:chemotaxis protein MotB
VTSPSSQIAAIDPRLTFASPNDNTSKSQASDDEGQADKAKPADAEVEKAIKEREQKQFEAVAEKLRKSVAEFPELKGLIDNLIIDETPEGLRIQLVDRDERPMFALGSAEPFDRTRQLLTLVTGHRRAAQQGVDPRTPTPGLCPGKAYDN